MFQCRDVDVTANYCKSVLAFCHCNWGSDIMGKIQRNYSGGLVTVKTVVFTADIFTVSEVSKFIFRS